MTAVTHKITVVRSEKDNYKAVCECGWSGKWRASAPFAVRDGQGHVLNNPRKV